MEFLYYLCTQVCCTIILLHQVSEFETEVNNIYIFFLFRNFSKWFIFSFSTILKCF